MRASPPDEFHDLQWTIYSKREGSAFGPLANFGIIKKQEEQTATRIRGLIFRLRLTLLIFYWVDSIP